MKNKKYVIANIATGVLRRGYVVACTAGMVVCLVGCGGGQKVGELSDLLEMPWQVETLQVQGVHLATARHAGEGVLRVYIEGDGRAYISRGQVSGDPTPLNAVALQVARADLGNVLYVARPCQYVQAPTRAECRDRSLYTSKRWAPAVTDVYVALLQPYVQAGQGLELVGYSGGAYVALAVASRLPEGAVQRVVTVAGNLSPNAVFAHHKVSKVEVAPLDWQRLGGVEMLHVVGMRDTVIPRTLQQAFVAEAGDAGRQAVATGRWRWVEVDATHGEGWEGLRW